MRHWALALALAATPALAVSPAAQEFLEVSKKLESVQCEKMKLRRALAIAEVERDDATAKALRERFEEINRDKEVTRMERRLAELQPRILDDAGRPRHAGDLDAISAQRRAAYYRCG